MGEKASYKTGRAGRRGDRFRGQKKGQKPVICSQGCWTKKGGSPTGSGRLKQHAVARAGGQKGGGEGNVQGAGGEKTDHEKGKVQQIPRGSDAKKGDRLEKKVVQNPWGGCNDQKGKRSRDPPIH